jgi:hypothetical protein
LLEERPQDLGRVVDDALERRVHRLGRRRDGEVDLEDLLGAIRKRCDAVVGLSAATRAASARASSLAVRDVIGRNDRSFSTNCTGNRPR